MQEVSLINVVHFYQLEFNVFSIKMYVLPIKQRQLHITGNLFSLFRHWVITFPFLIVFLTLLYMVGVLVGNVMHIPHFEDLDTLTGK